jgi:hypothetical protein
LPDSERGKAHTAIAVSTFKQLARDSQDDFVQDDAQQQHSWEKAFMMSWKSPKQNHDALPSTLEYPRISDFSRIWPSTKHEIFRHNASKNDDFARFTPTVWGRN